MEIDEEDGDYESSSVTHEVLNGPDLTREVRWFRDSRHAYRWSESGNRWVYLGSARSMNYAEYLAGEDMYTTHSRR
jgi:hypothetical protein